MNALSFPRRSRKLGLQFAVVDRMVSMELAKTLGSVLLVLVVIIVSRKFLDILKKAIEGEISGETVFQLLGLKMLSATAILLPAALFMAVLTVLGRMYRDQEMAILASAGVGPLRLYRALSWTVVPVCILSSVLALQVMPWSERQIQQVLIKDEKSADIRGIKPGRFNEFSLGDVVLYAEEIENDAGMQRIFVQSRQGRNVGIVVADTGRLARNELNENFVVLNDGRRYQGIPGRADFLVSQFKEYGVRIDSPESESSRQKREAQDSAELWRRKTPRELAELQKRLAVPLGILFLVLLAVPLARVAPRKGVYGNVFTAFLIYVVYENLQKISQGMLMTGKISYWLSFSGVYILLLSITALLFVRNLGTGWVLHKLRKIVAR